MCLIERTVEKELELLNPPPSETKTLKEEIEDGVEHDDDYDVNLVHGLEKVVIPSKKFENFERGLNFFSRKSNE